MMQMPAQHELPETLPPLRSDIIVEQGGVDFNSSPTWLIHDKLNNQFFHLGWKEYEVLRYWEAIAPADFLSKLNQQSLVEVSEQDLVNIIKFLTQNCLVELNYSSIKQVKDFRTPKSMHWLLWLAKNYLFFRIPLVRPNDFLSAIFPYARFMLGKGFGLFMLMLAFVGLLFILREWDQFSHTFFALFSLEYILIYAIALVFAKSCHEMGHALLCKKYGLNVPTMGVAFLVMFPMLYTDTSESWRVNNPKKRITIALAGVITETYIAIFALWAWLLLPAGSLRSICFFLATYSLMTTLLINSSPFLRFDGYHVLSDILSMRNLQTRSFAITRWRLRKLLFGFTTPPPEYFIPSKQRLLMVYAVLTWLYRFFLFLGIAILVYYLFFKTLGILLFIIEIIYFIVQPIYRELQVWWRLRQDIKLNKHTISLVFAIVILLLLFFIPWQSTISLPATLSYKTQTLFTETPARVSTVYVEKGQQVNKGDILVQLTSQELEFNIAEARQRLLQFQWEIRNAVHFQTALKQKNVLESQINHTKTKLAQMLKKQNELVIRAPFSGKIESLSEDLHVGAWLKKQQAILLLVDQTGLRISAYANSQQQQQLKIGQAGDFVPENIDLSKIAVRISQIINYPTDILYGDKQDQQHLSFIRKPAPESAYHASTFGGEVVVNADKKGQLKPEKNIFLVLLDSQLPENYVLEHVIRGRVFFEVSRKSLAARLWRQILILWVKESGF